MGLLSLEDEGDQQGVDGSRFAENDAKDHECEDLASQLWLPRETFDRFTYQVANTDSGTDRAKTDSESSAD
jgi:hypothetical protein